MEQALGAIDAEIGRSEAADSPIEVTFVSHVQTDRTIELYCAGEHVHDLRSGEVYQTSASANQRWTARCGGSTVQVWDVRTGRATAFEVPADTPLPVNRGRGRRVVRHARLEAAHLRAAPPPARPVRTQSPPHPLSSPLYADLTVVTAGAGARRWRARAKRRHGAGHRPRQHSRGASGGRRERWTQSRRGRGPRPLLCNFCVL